MSSTKVTVNSFSAFWDKLQGDFPLRHSLTHLKKSNPCIVLKSNKMGDKNTIELLTKLTQINHSSFQGYDTAFTLVVSCADGGLIDGLPCTLDKLNTKLCP